MDNEAVIDNNLVSKIKSTSWADYDGNPMNLNIALHTVLGNMSLPTMVSSPRTTHVKPEYKKNADLASLLDGNLDLERIRKVPRI